MRGENLNTTELSRKIIETLEEKKAEDILLIDIHEVADFTSVFILCSGSSIRMLDALANYIVDVVKKHLPRRPRIEGQPEEGWLVLDMGDIVLHLFTPDQREYYKIEELWSEGKVLLHLQ
jgi:ribosome-associated protein